MANATLRWSLFLYNNSEDEIQASVTSERLVAVKSFKSKSPSGGADAEAGIVTVTKGKDSVKFDSVKFDSVKFEHSGPAQPGLKSLGSAGWKSVTARCRAMFECAHSEVFVSIQARKKDTDSWALVVSNDRTKLPCYFYGSGRRD